MFELQNHFLNFKYNAALVNGCSALDYSTLLILTLIIISIIINLLWQEVQAAQKDMRKAQKAADTAKRGVKGPVPATSAEATAQLQELRSAADAGVEVQTCHI